MTIEEFCPHYENAEADFGEDFNILKLCNKLKIDYVQYNAYTYFLFFDDRFIRVQMDFNTRKYLIRLCDCHGYPISEFLRYIERSNDRIIKEEKDLNYKKESLKRHKRYNKKMIAFKEKHNIKEEE